MIRLQDQSLSAKSLTQLDIHQQRVNAEPDYPAKVARASRMWRPKNKAFDEVVEKLVVMCPGTRRCCYCEDGRGDDVEHFFPKTLYPELAFAWQNYLLACSACNSNAKRNQFAVFDAANVEHDVTRARGAAMIQPPSGNPVLINPRYENPLDYFEIELLMTFSLLPHPNLDARARRRAEYTIDILQLNDRTELTDWRRESFEAYLDWLARYKQYRDNKSKRITRQIDRLRRIPHLAVWEEMKRLYRSQSNLDWKKITTTYSHIAEMNDYFIEMPEVLEIGI